MLLEIKEQVRQNTLLLKALQGKQQVADVGDFDDHFSLPLETEADVAEINEKLKDKDKYKFLVSHNMNKI